MGWEDLFTVDVCGRFEPGQVRIVWHQDAPEPDAQIEELKSVWAEHVEAAARRGGVLFNGAMVRYLRHHIETGTLVIEAGPTDYATFYCTNYLNPHLGERLGWHRFANPIGISANVITSDGWLIYGRRGDQVAMHPGTVHTIGGTIEPSDRTAAGDLDAFTSMAREICEELRLEREKLVELTCLGMIRDARIRQPELVFDARVTCRRDELVARLAADDLEHASLVACPDNPAAFAEWLSSTPDIVPVAVGSLQLHGRCAGQSDRSV